LGRTHTKQVFGKVGNKESSFWEGWKARNKATSFWEIRQETRHVKKTIKNISKRDSRQGWLLLFLQNDMRLQYNLALLVLH
jgi:hypothetical protein